MSAGHRGPIVGPMLVAVVRTGNGDLYGLIGLAAGALAVLTYGLLGVAQLGFFRRAKHLLIAEYHEFDAGTDGLETKTARFALRLHNQGARPVTFLGFEFLTRASTATISSTSAAGSS